MQLLSREPPENLNSTSSFYTHFTIKTNSIYILVHKCYRVHLSPSYGWTWDSGGTGRDQDTSLFSAPDCTSCLRYSGDPEVRWCSWLSDCETVKTKIADLKIRTFATFSFTTTFPKKSSVPFSFLASFIILNKYKYRKIDLLSLRTFGWGLGLCHIESIIPS